MQKLYLVDAINLLYRAYYAIGPMTNPKGESTNALFGFIRSIFKIMKEFPCDYIVAVFDGKESKRERVKIYNEYKAHRKSMADDMLPQLLKAMEFCEIAGIPLLAVEGVEADDTIGSIIQWTEKKGITSYIFTSDKDLCQLVSDQTFLINLDKNNLLMDKKKVEEVFAVKPEQIVDYLAIMGDASDNIPGIEGFGPKTASSLLQQYGTLENILANADKVPGKKGEILAKSQEVALLSKKLAEINLGVECPKEEDFYHLKTPDVETVKAFYQEMNFLSLLKELDSSSPVEKKSDEKTTYTLVDDETGLENLLATLRTQKEICVDTETTELRSISTEVVGIGLGISPKKAWYIPTNGNLGKERVIEALKPLIENPHIGFYGHNIKYDYHALYNEGIVIKKICFDTMLASYLLQPQNQRHNLDQVSLEKFGKVKIEIESLIGKGKAQISMSEVPIPQVSEYCCEDVDYTCRIKELFEQELQKQGIRPILDEMEIPLIFILAKMERNGIYVDLKKLEKMSEELTSQIAILEKEIHKMAGEDFNISSPKQLGVILFEKMGIKPPKKTATGYSTSAEVLESLSDEAPIVKEILEYRTLEKLRSTYVDSLPLQIYPKTKRIHCTFNQSVAATGRLSCQDPNLQNIPVRSPIGRKIREAFKPEHHGWSYLAADYSQIELRLLAHLSDDPALIKAFQEGEDIHAYTASLVFNVPLKEVTSDMRYKAKAVNFGIVYGQQAFGLSKIIGVSYQEANQFIATYFQRYKKIKEYLNFCIESARQTGKSVTLTGRQRPIPDITSQNPFIRAAAERLAINTPLQGTAADLIKLAMIHIDDVLQKQPELGMMILQIHDELLFEAPDAHLDTLSSKVKKIMENVFTLKVPLLVEISIGKNWGEC